MLQRVPVAALPTPHIVKLPSASVLESLFPSRSFFNFCTFLLQLVKLLRPLLLGRSHLQQTSSRPSCLDSGDPLAVLVNPPLNSKLPLSSIHLGIPPVSLQYPPNTDSLRMSFAVTVGSKLLSSFFHFRRRLCLYFRSILARTMLSVLQVTPFFS